MYYIFGYVQLGMYLHYIDARISRRTDIGRSKCLRVATALYKWKSKRNEKNISQIIITVIHRWRKSLMYTGIGLIDQNKNSSTSYLFCFTLWWLHLSLSSICCWYPCSSALHWPTSEYLADVVQVPLWSTITS